MNTTDPTTCATCGVERRAADGEWWLAIQRTETLPDGGVRETAARFCSLVCLSEWAERQLREQTREAA